MSTDKLSEGAPKDDVEDIKDASSLSELFDKAFELFNNINKTEEPTNSSQVQCDVKRAMRMFEDATKLVSLVDMFSENEHYEEVPTENLKYFLLPAFLGTLTTKICGAEDRTHLLNVAEIYFVDFLKRVIAYGLSNIEIPTTSSNAENETAMEHVKSNAEKITEMVNRRNTKIQRFNEKKELESSLQVMQKNMDNLNIDDETKREYFITLIKLYVNQAIEELGPLDAERRLLEQMKTLGSASSTNVHKPKPPQAKLQPIIITRDELQKKVYGAGYPSLPVLTVQEFYDQKVKEGDWPDPAQRNQIGGKSLQDMANSSNQNEGQDAEQAEDESKIEQDDPEYLARKRAMDEYKDTHKRGWGNRANRS